MRPKPVGLFFFLASAALAITSAPAQESSPQRIRQDGTRGNPDAPAEARPPCIPAGQAAPGEEDARCPDPDGQNPPVQRGRSSANPPNRQPQPTEKETFRGPQTRNAALEKGERMARQLGSSATVDVDAVAARFPAAPKPASRSAESGRAGPGLIGRFIAPPQLLQEHHAPHLAEWRRNLAKHYVQREHRALELGEQARERAVRTCASGSLNFSCIGDRMLWRWHSQFIANIDALGAHWAVHKDSIGGTAISVVPVVSAYQEISDAWRKPSKMTIATATVASLFPFAKKFRKFIKFSKTARTAAAGNIGVTAEEIADAAKNGRAAVVETGKIAPKTSLINIQDKN